MWGLIYAKILKILLNALQTLNVLTILFNQQNVHAKDIIEWMEQHVNTHVPFQISVEMSMVWNVYMLMMRQEVINVIIQVYVKLL